MWTKLGQERGHRVGAALQLTWHGPTNAVALELAATTKSEKTQKESSEKGMGIQPRVCLWSFVEGRLVPKLW